MGGYNKHIDKRIKDEEDYTDGTKGNPVLFHAYSEIENEEEGDCYSDLESQKSRRAKFWELLTPHKRISPIEKQFNELASKWKKETGGYSTTLHITRSDYYLDIIGMGEIVIPFILKDLKLEPDYWFVALKHITKVNPVPIEHLGDIEKMTQDWLAWGGRNNLI